jgi:hypothetical protein
MYSNICPGIDGVGTGSFEVLSWSTKAEPSSLSTKALQRGEKTGGQKFIEQRHTH